MGRKKIFFFDRDGTLIKNIPYLNDVNKIEYFDDTVVTLKSLRDLGFEFIILTNQSGLARGLITFQEMTRIHKKIRSDFAGHGLTILDIFYSPYHPDALHFSRKPEPGMIVEACRRYSINKEKSYLVGDSECDVLAGKAADVRTFFLSGKENSTPPTYEISCLSEILCYL